MLELFLLGHPHATRDGRPVEVRGAKAWALLAYLLLADGPVARAGLAQLLFPDADDPAASLRWNLSQLRRALGISLEGDPLQLRLPAGTWIDIEILADGDATEAAAIPDAERQLLDGLSFDGSESFTIWLDGERRHLHALTADVLREAALRCLTRNDTAAAVTLAERVVHLDPFDENAAVLLVRSLREAGRTSEALAFADSTARRIREELGVEPSATLWSAAHASTGRATRSDGRTAVEAQLEAGEAALTAGMPDAGIDALREALGGARALGHADLSARCLTALGSALIHAVRGSDQDGLVLLHEAIPLAASAELGDVAARAHRELGYVDLLRGRYRRAQRWFTQAAVHAASDDQELAWIAAWTGAARTDVADYAAAQEVLDEAVGRSTTSESHQAAAVAHTMRGRLRLLDDRPARSRTSTEPSRSHAPSDGARSNPGPRPSVPRSPTDATTSTTRPPSSIPHWRPVGRSTTPAGNRWLCAGSDSLPSAVAISQAGWPCCKTPHSNAADSPTPTSGSRSTGSTPSRTSPAGHGLPEAGSWIEQLDDVATRHGMRAMNQNAAHYRTR